MDKGLSLFRVFDLAFFLPGVVLFGAFFFDPPAPPSGWPGVSDTKGIVLLVLAIAAIFIAGLLVHGIIRLYKVLRRGGAKTSAPWYSNLSEGQRHDLACYFWYLRSTCRNLALVMPVSAIAVVVRGVAEGCMGVLALCGAILTAMLLNFMARDFDAALRTAASKATEANGE